MPCFVRNCLRFIRSLRGFPTRAPASALTAKKKLQLKSDHRGFARIAYWIIQLSQSSGVHGSTHPRTTAPDPQSSEDAWHAGRRTTGTTGTAEAEPLTADEATFAARDADEDGEDFKDAESGAWTRFACVQSPTPVWLQVVIFALVLFGVFTR